MNYWQKRNRIAQNNVANKSVKDIEKQLAKYYKQTLKRTIADFEATYDKLLATMDEGRQPTPADLYKLDKYWQMQSQLQAELQKLGDKELELFSQKFTTAYKGVYENLALPSEKSFATIDTQMAQQMISDVWCADNKSWSERIWDNTAKLAETLNNELIECVVGGKKTTDLKKKLMERFEISYAQADSLARTEIAHIQTQAAQKRYKDAGLELVEVWADKDERRCDLCGKLHQKRYKVGEKVPIPAHPNCRCCIIPVIGEPVEEPVKITIEPKTQPKPQQEKPQPQPAQIEPKREENALGFSIIKGKHSVADDTASVNPNYTTGPLYRNNCGNCSVSYELRRRGYDVEALGAKSMYVNEWKRMFKDFEPLRVGAKRKVGVIPEITGKCQSWGDGARGTIFVQWDGRTFGHFFNIEVENGEVKFIDAQSGETDVSEYFKRVKPSSIIYGRLDNLEPSDDVKKACKNRGEMNGR